MNAFTAKVKYLIGGTVLLAGFLLTGSGTEPQPPRGLTPTPPLATQKVTLRGIVPTEPVDKLHIVCLESTMQFDKPVVELGKAGQPFEWTAEIPSVASELLIEASHTGKRWPIGSHSLIPGGPPLINLASLSPPPQLATNLKPYQSNFQSAKDSTPSYQETQPSQDPRRQEPDRVGLRRHRKVRQ